MTYWPSITSIELLIAAAAHGSISAAATSLGLSQASASRRLDRLENATLAPSCPHGATPASR